MQHKRDACMPIRTRPVHIRFVLRTTHSISLYCFLLHRIELVADPSHNTFWISLFFITSKRTCRSVHASNQILLPASKREQEKLDDDQSAAKMGGESGPTGRAILFRKQKYMTNAEINYGNSVFYSSSYDYKYMNVTCSHWSLPILPSATMLKEYLTWKIACSPLIPGAFAKRPVNYICRSSLQKTSD